MIATLRRAFPAAEIVALNQLIQVHTDSPDALERLRAVVPASHWVTRAAAGAIWLVVPEGITCRQARAGASVKESLAVPAPVAAPVPEQIGLFGGGR